MGTERYLFFSKGLHRAGKNEFVCQYTYFCFIFMLDIKDENKIIITVCHIPPATPQFL